MAKVGALHQWNIETMVRSFIRSAVLRVMCYSRSPAMTDITELAQRMKAAAGKATQGEWWADEVKNEGCYGSGDDCMEGFTSYAIYGSDGQTLFDSLNSDAACICEEYDGEGHVAWDETAQRNAEFIALANPANILALVEALEKAQETIAFQQGEIKALLSSLESRTVTVKLPDIMPPEAAPAHYWGSGESMAYADGYNKSAADLKTSIALSCSSAGVNVEFE
ncbi:TPA: hypothetical protein MFS50_07590 [Klebsiella pneumoniae]|nr:hypothetical protein [Klebsiella pneumoniae]